MTEQDRNHEQENGGMELSDEAREDRSKAEEEEVAERRRAETSPDPHHELANPASDPDPTEYPDPYEERDDPRAPGAVDAPAETGEGESEGRGEETPRDPSTSDPPPPRNIERLRDGEGRGRLAPATGRPSPAGRGAPAAPAAGTFPRVGRQRIDTLLAERGLAGSRTSAAASVRAGRVRIGRDGPFASKPGQLVADDAELLLTEPPRYVSRGGLKLEAALEALAIDAEGLSCLDVGASTGGFTDCLLKRGAARVIALDVGRGQLDWRLRSDPRVDVVEGLNARELRPADLAWAPELATIDASFIAVTKLLAPVASCLVPHGELLALVKPQFELAPRQVEKGGVVRSAEGRREALRRAAAGAAEAGLVVRGLASSGLPGPKGNRETFIRCAWEGAPVGDLEEAIAEVEP